MEKYRFYTDGANIVVCTTHFHGEIVRGVAKCSPDDPFDINVGKEIAKARCEQKYYSKKKDHAFYKLSHAQDVLDNAKYELERMEKYYEDASRDRSKSVVDLVNIENKYY